MSEIDPYGYARRAIDGIKNLIKGEIVGTGDIGSVMPKRNGALIFASGVSNSRCENEEEFKREKQLLLSQPKDLCIFYFSSMSIYYKDSPYTTHKKAMEQLIKSNWNHYNIIRLGNITFGKNPNTFINAIRAKKEKGEPYTLFDEWRYLIDEDDLVTLVSSLPLKGQFCINAFSRMAKPKDCI